MRQPCGCAPISVSNRVLHCEHNSDLSLRALVFPIADDRLEKRYDPPDDRTHDESQREEKYDAAEGAIAAESNKRGAHDERPNNKVITFRFGQHYPAALLAHPQ